VGYVFLSPYAATRRYMGMVVVASLLCCRLGAATCSDRRGWMWATCGFNFLLSLFLFGIDVNYTQVQKDLAENIARDLHRRRPQATIWYYGLGTFTFYGEQAGMKRWDPEATLSAKDWVIVVDHFERNFADVPQSVRCQWIECRHQLCRWPLTSKIQAGGAAFTHLEEWPPGVSIFQVN
jgi:hypothetical protein